MVAAGRASFPADVGISRLHVYPWPAADGDGGGAAHVHLTCTECYVVIEGAGCVQTLTSRGYAETPLEPDAVVWFTPGTIHRVVDRSGDLQIVVVTQNGGMPDAGDCVLTFPPAVLGDAGAYRRAARLESEDGADGAAAARRRRDLAVEGFLALRQQVEAGDLAALDAFYRTAAARTADLVDGWAKRWAEGAARVAGVTGRQLQRLRRGDWKHLLDAGVYRIPPPLAENREYGVCGRVDVYRPGDGVLQLTGSQERALRD